MLRSKKVVLTYAIRLAVIMAASFILVAVFNELTFMGQRDPSDRGARTLELVIPEGTAERVAAGEAVPSIPEDMSFVVGDTLLVVNQDRVDHQLGPVWVPAGSSGSLVMRQVEKYAYSCSFQQDQVMGINVRPATDIATRLVALALAGPTTGLLLFLYSIVMFPVKKTEDQQASRQASGAAD